VSPQVVLFSRPGCCLCDDAREVLLQARARYGFDFQERDIDQDDTLLRAYLERIPVVTIDGVEAFELFVDPATLSEALAGGSGD
jgi:glutaredoxin